MGVFCSIRKLICVAGSSLNLIAATLLLYVASVPAQAEKVTTGWLERVHIVDPDFDIKLRAKLDTGAKSTSLHARNIEYFRRNGDLWVRFDFSWDKPNEKIDRIELEYPLKQHVRIRRHDTDSHHRPVIELTICLGNTLHYIDVNLISRSRFNYPMLIGREVLKGKYLIDPDSVFTAKPVCKKKIKSADTDTINDAGKDADESADRSESDVNTDNEKNESQDHQDNV